MNAQAISALANALAAATLASHSDDDACATSALTQSHVAGASVARACRATKRTVARGWVSDRHLEAIFRSRQSMVIYDTLYPI